MKFSNTVALITGGASGLGFATARALIAKGSRAVLLDLPSSNGAAAASSLGVKATFIAADVRDEAQVQAAVDRAAELGDLRIVVNCAGIGDPVRALGRSGPSALERFRRVIDINLIGTFNVIRLAAERMVSVEESGGERGIIVTTASVAAFDGQIGQASYSASKAGIAGMTLPLAREFAERKIRIMTIAPGIFETPILEGLSEEIRASLGRQVPHPSRLGRPDEYAALVTHLVENSMLNGEVIRLDGAIRMAAQ